jgi:uncharacterized protein YkwD
MTRARLLVVALALVTALAVPVAPAAAKSPTSKMIQQVNAFRKHRGLRGLHASRSLNHSASAYAHHMMRSQYFGHAATIHASHSFRTLGEIIEIHRGGAAGVSHAVHAWANSGGHRAIMLDGRFRWVGAGKATGRFHGHRMTIWVMQYGQK